MLLRRRRQRKLEKIARMLRELDASCERVATVSQPVHRVGLRRAA